MRLIFAILCVAFSAAASLPVRRSSADGARETAHVRLALSGQPIGRVHPSGWLSYDAGRRHARLVVAVRRVNLPNAVLLARVDGVAVGYVVLGRRGNGRLLLSTRGGDLVPIVHQDSLIEIRERESGRLVLTNATTLTPIAVATVLFRRPRIARLAAA